MDSEELEYNENGCVTCKWGKLDKYRTMSCAFPMPKRLPAAYHYSQPQLACAFDLESEDCRYLPESVRAYVCHTEQDFVVKCPCWEKRKRNLTLKEIDKAVND